MSTAPRPSRRRARAAAQPHQNDVASILARRDELDGVKADQRDRENALVDEYLSATAEETAIEARRDAVFADLEEQRRKAVQDAEQAVGATRKRRAATIVELHKRRSVQQLGIMLKLPRRRIDKLIRLHNEHTVPQNASVGVTEVAAKTGPTNVTKDSTAASPPVTSGRPPRPPQRSPEPAFTTTAEPNSIPTAVPAQTEGPADCSVEADRLQPLDDTDRLF